MAPRRPLRLQAPVRIGKNCEECICFPAGELVLFRTDSEHAMAAKLQCPLFGRRLPALQKRWLEFQFRRSSAQFKKAW